MEPGRPRVLGRPGETAATASRYFNPSASLWLLVNPPTCLPFDLFPTCQSNLCLPTTILGPNVRRTGSLEGPCHLQGKQVVSYFQPTCPSTCLALPAHTSPSSRSCASCRREEGRCIPQGAWQARGTIFFPRETLGSLYLPRPLRCHPEPCMHPHVSLERPQASGAPFGSQTRVGWSGSVFS